MGHCMFLRKGETHTAPLSGILASDIAVGSTVKLMENGVAVEYLVVNQGIPSGSSLYDSSCDGMWVLRKDIYEKRQWHSSNVNNYANSTIHSYLNSTFLALFDANIQSAIKQVKIPCVNGTANSAVASGANGLSAKIFLLSGYEIGRTKNDASYIPVDGAKLKYFKTGITTEALNLRIAYYNGTATNWWLRSTHTGVDYASLYNSGSGTTGDNSCTDLNGIRPALVLPSTALFDKNTLILKGVA